MVFHHGFNKSGPKDSKISLPPRQRERGRGGGRPQRLVLVSCVSQKDLLIENPHGYACFFSAGWIWQLWNAKGSSHLLVHGCLLVCQVHAIKPSASYWIMWHLSLSSILHNTCMLCLPPLPQCLDEIGIRRCVGTVKLLECFLRYICHLRRTSRQHCNAQFTRK